MRQPGYEARVSRGVTCSVNIRAFNVSFPPASPLSSPSRVLTESRIPRDSGGQSGPLRAVHLSRHKWPGGLVDKDPDGGESPTSGRPLSHPGVELWANLKSSSHRCHLFEVAFVWELTKETIRLPLGCIQGGGRAKGEVHPERSPPSPCPKIDAGLS